MRRLRVAGRGSRSFGLRFFLASDHLPFVPYPLRDAGCEVAGAKNLETQNKEPSTKNLEQRTQNKELRTKNLEYFAITKNTPLHANVVINMDQKTTTVMIQLC